MSRRAALLGRGSPGRGARAALAGLLFPALAFAAAAEQPVRELTSYQGVVTLHRSGDRYFFVHADDGRNWRCETVFAQPGPQSGDLVAVRDAALEKARSRYTTRSFGGELTVLGHDASRMPAPVFMSLAELHRLGPQQLPEPDYYAQLVETEGLVYDIIRREFLTSVFIKDGEERAAVSVSISLAEPMPPDIRIGARVKACGAAVYSPVRADAGRIVGIQAVSVLMDGFDGLVVLRRAPWWTLRRAMVLAGLLLAVIFGSWVWVFLLRRAVVRQSERLAVSIRAQHNERLEADAARRERLRLAADLHDGFQQLLAGAMFRIDAAFGALPDSIPAAMQQLAEAREALAHTQSGLRTALWSMTEESEGPGSLAALFRHAANRLSHWRGRVFIVAEGDEIPFARRARGSLLMVLQEAVGNALRHGRASRVDVTLAYRPDRLVMTIADNGCGFDVARCTPGIGLDSLRRRLQEMGGSLSVRSEIGRGSVVCAEVPYPAKEG
ncbi:MAG: sensor histidine kinase [Kiritimatiellia bacterium]